MNPDALVRTVEEEAVEVENAFKMAAETAEQRVKELEKQAEEYRNRIAVTEMLYDCFKERMARKYSYDYNSNTSIDESDTEESNNTIDNEIKSNRCDICNFVGKTKGGLKTHKKRRRIKEIKQIEEIWPTRPECTYKNTYVISSCAAQD